jgi:DNA-binding transcriptional regulator YiaG
MSIAEGQRTAIPSIQKLPRSWAAGPPAHGDPSGPFRAGARRSRGREGNRPRGRGIAFADGPRKGVSSYARTDLKSASDNRPYTRKMSRLRKLREATGLSQSDVAKLVGVTVSTVSRWENGINPPTFAHRRKLARVYRCTLEELGIRGLGRRATCPTPDASRSTRVSPSRRDCGRPCLSRRAAFA